MSKKRIIGILTATALCLGMVPATIAAAPADKEESVPSGEGTKIYADYGEGFEFLASLTSVREYPKRRLILQVMSKR